MRILSHGRYESNTPLKRDEQTGTCTCGAVMAVTRDDPEVWVDNESGRMVKCAICGNPTQVNAS